MKTLKTLLKEYELKQDAEYFEYFDMVYNSYMNGQKEQARAQFLAMQKDDRKDCYMYFDDFYDNPEGAQLTFLKFFFYLI
jgi:hypothetical protein